MSGTLTERLAAARAARAECSHAYPGGLSALVPVPGTSVAACWICDGRVAL